MRGILAGAEAAELFFLRDVDPDLEDDHAGLGQAGLEVVDLGVGAGPLGVLREALDAFDHHAAEPGTIEDREPAGRWHLVPEAPEIVAGLFLGRRRRRREDLVVRRVEQAAEATDRAALAGGVGAFEYDHRREALLMG